VRGEGGWVPIGTLTPILTVNDSKRPRARHDIKLILLPGPEEAKGSVEIPWSIEEFEEGGEELVHRRG